ncbi:nitrous oxide reductase accessory protein NosL [Sedimenticola hydrogenitrophicus]|uniref:nitrous oxide reductase accessory protein NosL n=1 Tax=Sedimenticola hydrogenitrophicus TaxID=2967975 RepID=UPI0023B1FD6B|nr:nitrous oxide reductase accessory protein NosL [Sedimenticola hydrogenitrophicus]
MCEEKMLDRRGVLKLLAVAGLGSLAGPVVAGPGVGAMVPGKGWVKASGEACQGDGTPLQFIPKRAPDADPLENELEKYPACPYCGMNRTQWQHSRHLVQYDDDLVDGTCSIHCLAISLSLNLDRGPKAIYAADFGAADKVKPLVNVDTATYLLGSKLKGTMTASSKMAFASAEAARAAQAEQGGELTSFDEGLKAAYLGMAQDTLMIRKRRAEKVRKMMQMKKSGG